MAFLADTFSVDLAPTSSVDAEGENEGSPSLLTLCNDLRLERIGADKARDAYEKRARRVSLKMTTDQERREIDALHKQVKFCEQNVANLTDWISDVNVTTKEEAVAKLFAARARTGDDKEGILTFLLLDDVIGFLQHGVRS